MSNQDEPKITYEIYISLDNVNEMLPCRNICQMTHFKVHCVVRFDEEHLPISKEEIITQVTFLFLSIPSLC